MKKHKTREWRYEILAMLEESLGSRSAAEAWLEGPNIGPGFLAYATPADAIRGGYGEAVASYVWAKFVANPEGE